MNSHKKISHLALLPIVLALVVGVIHTLPSVYVPLRLGQTYKGIFPFQSADEEHYDVTIKMAMEGFYHHANNYIAEKRMSQVGGIPPLRADSILGFIGGAAGLSIGSYILLLRFFLPALAFLLIYALFRNLKMSRLAALVFAFLNLLAPYLFYGWVEPFSRPLYDVLAKRGTTLIWYEQYAIAALPLARVINPQFTGLFFIAALFSLIKIIKGERPVIWFLVALVLFYINWKFYFYFWSALAVMLPVTFILSIIFRNRKALVPLGISLMMGAIKIVPYLLSVLRTIDYAGLNYTYVLSRHFLISPACTVAIVLLLAGICLTRKRKMSPPDAVLYFTMPLACLLFMNQQILTGKVVQPWHYELFTSPILLSITLAILFRHGEPVIRFLYRLNRKFNYSEKAQTNIEVAASPLLFFGGATLFFYYFHLAPRMTDAMLYIVIAAIEILVTVMLLQVSVIVVFKEPRRLRRFLSISFIIFLTFEGLTRQAYISAISAQRVRPLQVLAPALQWLNKHTTPNSVVMSGFETAERIPLYTHNAVYMCKNAIHENMGIEERNQRSMNYFLLAGYDTERFREKLAQWPYGYLFWGVRELQPNKDVYSFGKIPPVSEDFLKNILVKYEKKSKTSLTSIAGEYTLNYIFFGPEERAFFQHDPASLPFVQKVYGDNTPIIIYQLKIDK